MGTVETICRILELKTVRVALFLFVFISSVLFFIMYQTQQLASKSQNGTAQSLASSTENKESKPDPKPITPQARVEAAKRLEDTYLRNGMDVYVSVRGKLKDKLVMKYVLLSRPVLYKIEHDGTLFNNLRSMGFVSVELTDGISQAWEYDLR